ncbi:4Fe-4S binding protein [Algoriphagus pacificus]|uniref:4Fe-4S binding protein n=1 Tax=Algoriphagus pacificus TaxID=2811234 RepID=A0ABS3CEU7_9BACT|nr:4Fe-4S binding protein [Algoriphagus pacificus]MBN7815629.1 4Fe-4S binding protein [Algoriphagus pacificus]
MKFIQKIGILLFLIGVIAFSVIPFLGTYTLEKEQVFSQTKDIHQEKMVEILEPMYGKEYNSNFSFLSDFNTNFNSYNDALKEQALWDQVIWDDYSFPLAKASLHSPVKDQPLLFLMLSIGLAMIGGLLYNLPKYSGEPAGIKNNGIFHSAMKNRGWMGMITGAYLILFYIILYWFPAYIVNLVAMVDPISILLSGNPASQWFLYGLIYTIAILVMGIRMFRKYRGNKYQQLRTASVMFFQTAFAFLIPEILVLFNQPYFDFKNIWPLDYDFFYAYQIDTFLSGGGVGMFMLIWGILLIIIGVPVFTYFFGKRWYCSWVCGCGGLAETVGDPYRQLSDKSLKAWKYERIIIHSVLVLAVVMTVLTIANYFSGFGLLGNVTNQLHSFYGFAIGSAFAGVVGTGFYPFMGNRVWCRFGCPLAAYLGLVQRFKSRFRITTNGGQCISCGNCSTYCEMGIDVRWYAQRGQNIVRSSCVGCGVCSSVCPRGVLKLENDSEDGRINELPIIIGNDSIKLNA